MKIHQSHIPLIQQWKDKVLHTLLYILLIFGAVAYIPSLIASLQDNLIAVAVIDTFAYGMVVILFFAKRLGYIIRTIAISLIMFILGILLIIVLGPFGAGPLWLFAFPIIACLLLSKQAGYLAVWINLTATIALGFFIDSQWLADFKFKEFSLISWAILSVNLICLNFITVYPVALIVSNMEDRLYKEAELNKQNTQIVKALEKSKKKLKRKNRELHKINQELDNFVYRVSHDLRAPLLSVFGLLQLNKLEKEEAQRSRYLDLIHFSLEKLDRFIKELINFSRNSRLDVTLEPIHFNMLVDSVIADLAYLDKFDQVTIAKDIRCEDEFVSDSYRLRIIFSNLVGNAIKYSSRIDKQPRLEISIHCDNTEAEMIFKDNGIGIPKEHLDQIFKMFYRASDSDVGSGLGLYIAHEAIIKLKGKIKVESVVNQGTTFVLKIPNQASKRLREVI